jgi:TonB-dependent SusC/RagA subfamily outer membrane receptor
MNLSKKLLFILCILLVSINTMAQNKILKGKIISTKDDSPVFRGNCFCKGTSTSVAAASDGSFSIPVNSSRATLVVSSVGFVNKEFDVDANDNNITLSLEANTTSMGEVVVVGYGSQRKSDLTGAVSSIKGADLTQLSTQRVDQAIQGRAAGVYVLNTAGAPGANTTIRVRGMNSINGGNNALVVVDGLQGGNLNSLNPNDIESMEILKDASATAIYGSRGANGVILITTKSGRKGKANDRLRF